MRGLCATPVAAVLLPGAEARNARLRETILEGRQQHASIQSSNAGGWHSSCDLENWGGGDSTEVLGYAHAFASQLTADTGLGAPHWNSHARATLTGMTRYTTRRELARAVLDLWATRPAICWTPCGRMPACQTTPCWAWMAA